LRPGESRGSPATSVAAALWQALSLVASPQTRHSAGHTGSSLIPLFTYSFDYDALSGFFNLILAILAGAVSIYSFSYLKEFEGKRNIGFFGFLFHLLLLSLTVVFTAANAFFLIGWEVMALVAYGRVTFYHVDRETRRAGLLYIVMAHIDAGCLLLGFALLMQVSGSAECASFHTAAAQLSTAQQAAAFVLFFLASASKRVCGWRIVTAEPILPVIALRK
jgi:hydrogenase-4 component B